ncbi:hypothetical protein CH263_17320 [Rhodococcus sp. 06-1059B-a]|nr:MaoC family dehydratase N-terminal domain-containing protein [Rhodococcus sp. 06-1059B-a]OZD62536.1 hypothetical protein CH263_17320 [Rhodococcus sp. 06-1059B-a]
MNDPVAVTVGAEPVTREAIRRFVEAHEMADPRFVDPVDPIAPWAMLSSFSMPAYWTPGDPSLSDGALPPLPWDACGVPAAESVTNRMEFEYFHPLRPGDVITTEYRVTGVTPKRTSVGDGSFVDFELTFLRQDGTVIARERCSVYRYFPFESRR